MIHRRPGDNYFLSFTSLRARSCAYPTIVKVGFQEPIERIHSQSRSHQVPADQTMKLTSRGEDGTASHVHVLASVWRVVLVDRRVRVRLGAHVQGGALVHHAGHVDLRLGRLLLAPALAALLVVPVLELPALRARHDDDRVVRGLVHD